jgi:hypothetical protein
LLDRKGGERWRDRKEKQPQTEQRKECEIARKTNNNNQTAKRSNKLATTTQKREETQSNKLTPSTKQHEQSSHKPTNNLYKPSFVSEEENGKFGKDC